VIIESPGFFGPGYPAATDLLMEGQTSDDVSQIAAFVERDAPRRAPRILDAPCGYGRLTVPLALHGLELAGCDLSEELLEVARARARTAGRPEIPFRRGDLTSACPFDGAFDYVVCWHHSLGYGSLEADVAILRNLLACLAPGGQILVQLLNQAAVIRHVDSLAKATFLAESELMRVRDTVKFDVLNSTLVTERTTYTRGATPTTTTLTARIYSAGDLANLVQRAGGFLLGAYGDAFRPLSLDSSHLLGVVSNAG
jgi:SAM-dependent methyltransferase